MQKIPPVYDAKGNKLVLFTGVSNLDSAMILHRPGTTTRANLSTLVTGTLKAYLVEKLSAPSADRVATISTTITDAANGEFTLLTSALNISTVKNNLYLVLVDEVTEGENVKIIARGQVDVVNGGNSL